MIKRIRKSGFKRESTAAQRLSNCKSNLRHVGQLGPGVDDAAGVLERRQDLVEVGDEVAQHNVLLPQIVLERVH